MSNFTENHDLVTSFIPVDMTTAANTGDFVSLKNWRHCTFVLYKAVGTAGQDPVITLAQATVVAGTDTKAAAIITEFRHKLGLAGALDALGVWTTVAQTAATTVDLTVAMATSAENSGWIIIDIDAEDLDVTNGFDCVQFSVADVGANTCLGGGFYILSDPRYARETASSAIAD